MGRVVVHSSASVQVGTSFIMMCDFSQILRMHWEFLLLTPLKSKLN